MADTGTRVPTFDLNKLEASFPTTNKNRDVSINLFQGTFDNNLIKTYLKS